jgi:alpha-tubulin suppressor-like RCC1 family protein
MRSADVAGPRDLPGVSMFFHHRQREVRSAACFAAAATVVSLLGVAAPAVASSPPPSNVLAWGANTNGQLGDGTTAAVRLVPVHVSGMSGVVAVAGQRSLEGGSDSNGSGAGYALRSDGTVWAWGRNNHGGLGNGTFTDSLVPVRVHGLTGVKAIAAAEGSGYALKTDGTVWAWGANEVGQLGQGNEFDRTTPAKVISLSNVKAISAAGSSAYALRTDGSEWSWGQDVGAGEWTGPITPHPWAGAVTGLSHVTAIGSDFSDGYAVETDGSVWEWGGIFTLHYYARPTKAEGVTGAVAVTGQVNAVYALLGSGKVIAWGLEQDGSGGNGDSGGGGFGPTLVSGLTGVKAIAAGAAEGDGYALKSDGTVWSWGSEQHGELGDGILSHTVLVPVQVRGVSHATAIGTGSEAAFAVVSP